MTASVAPEAWRRGDLSSVSTPIRDPLTGLAVPWQPDSGQQNRRNRARDPERRGELPAAEPHGAWRRDGELCRRHAARDPRPPGRRARGLERVEQQQVLRPLLVRALRGPARPAALPARRSPTRNDQPFHNVGFNWNRVVGSSMINELLVGYSSTTVDRGDARLGRRRRRQRRYGIAGGQPIDGLSSIGWGSGLTAARRDRARLGHPRQDLPAQREGDLDQGPPRDQVRRAVPALQPAPFLRRQQRVARLHQLQRRLHGLRVLRLPARPGVEQGPRRRRPERAVDAPAESELGLRSGRLQGRRET